VLDIGTGSGLLALIAARSERSGAVYACEADHRLQAVARQTLAGSKVKLIAKRSTEITLPEDLPRRASVIVCEIFDSALLGEDAVPTMRHAAEHLAAPDAIFVPARARILAWPVSAPGLYRCHDVSRIDPAAASLHVAPGAALSGLEAPGSCAGQPHPLQLHLGRAGALVQFQGVSDDADPGIRHLSAPVTAATVDFHACAAIPEDADGHPWNHHVALLQFETEGGGDSTMIHGVGVAFALQADGLAEGDEFATWPEPEPPHWREHWRPCFYPLASPVAVSGQALVLHTWMNARLIRFDVRAEPDVSLQLGAPSVATRDEPPVRLLGCRSRAHIVLTPAAIQLINNRQRRLWIVENVIERARESARPQHLLCLGDGSLDWVELAYLGADVVASVTVCAPHLLSHAVSGEYEPGSCMSTAHLFTFLRQSLTPCPRIVAHEWLTANASGRSAKKHCHCEILSARAGRR
jgi:hypothetical protein